MGKVDFFQNGLCFVCHLARNELIDFRQYHATSEATWAEQEKTVNDHISRLLEKYPEEEHDEIVESNVWELHQVQSKFPSVHRGSIVITLVSFLEGELNEICEIVGSSMEMNVNVRDLRGRGIERAFNYLSKVAYFDLSRMGAEIGYIKNVIRLRNSLVHNGSVLPSNPSDPLNQFVKKQESVVGSPGHAVSLHRDFVVELISMLDKFFEALGKEVQNFMQRVDG